MGYYKIKNLKIDKKANKISGMVADSNWRNWNGDMIYDYVEDLFSRYNTIGDKIAVLYHELLYGGIHIDYGKYKDFVNASSKFQDFINDYKAAYYNENRKDDDLYKVYLKHQNDFEDYAKKDCILKQKGYNNRYIVRVNTKSVSINYGKDKAKKFNSKTIKENSWYMENFEIEYV